KPQRPEVTILLPRFDGNRLFVSSFYHGATMYAFGTSGGQPSVAWNRRGKKDSEFEEGLHSLMCTPLLRDGYLYGVCGFGELRCLDAATGDRKWETNAATGGERGLFANAFLIEQAGRVWVWNDHGELILASLTPSGYIELGRAKLLEPIENTRGREVLWCHPAFAERRAYMHNGREMICVDLAAGRHGV
ncbi:MAG TPA: PQQ-binding-like beta-propeller repeat protein, partial [Verrucomicrobiae bacterium]